jgi:PAS domain S-box-containing protein
VRINLPVVLISVLLGLIFIAADVAVDRAFSHHQLITLPVFGDTTVNGIIMRFLILFLFIIFGIIFGKLLYRFEKVESEKSETTIFLSQLIKSVPIPIFYKDTEDVYLGCNEKFAEFLKMNREQIIGKSVYDIAPPALAGQYHAKDMELLNNPGEQVYEAEVADKNNKIHTVIFHKATFNDSEGKVGGMIGLIFDISELRQVEREREVVVTELKDALNQVKTLGGLLPICSACKKIRDDSGYWQRLETYFKKSTDVDFSHSICPDCAQKLFEEYEDENEQKTE